MNIHQLKKYDHLIIAIACFLVCLFCLSRMSFAETTISTKYHLECNAFKSGYELKIETIQRFKPTAIRVYADMSNRKKNHAKTGYTWGYGVQES